MKAKFFALIILIVCVALISGCASSIEYEEVETPELVNAENGVIDSSDTQDVPTTLPYPEPRIPTALETEFISMLNEVGLNWSISERQGGLPPPADHQQIYMITCPTDLTLGLITIRNNEDSIWGEKYIHMSFMPQREVTEEEFNKLQQEGLLTEEAWLLFWAFAGKLLGEEEQIVQIAAQSLYYFEQFPFLDETEPFITIMEGHEGNVDYSLTLLWHPFLERYAQYEISLTVGLSEFFRELRKTIEWHP